MTDTPGWASPGSSEPPRDGARPPADAPAAVPGPSAPPQATPAWGAQYGQPNRGTQPPGHGPYGWESARSPRPGVIPLRPLSIGELLDGAVTTVRRHWRTALTLSLGIAVLNQAGDFVAQLLVRGRTGASTQLLTLLATLPLTLLLDALAVSLLTIVVSRAVLGRPVTAGDAWRDARPRLLQLLGLTVLTTLMSVGVVLLGFTPLIGYLAGGANSPGTTGLLLLVGVLTIPVGLWLLIRYSLAAPALMLEKQGVVTALSRSRRLARGAWWRILGITALSRILAVIAGATLLIPFRFLGLVLGFGSMDRLGQTSQESIGMMVLTAVAGIIASALTTPFLAAVGVLVYIDQRIRREALDIELARAAGLPEGGTGWNGQADQTPARH